MWALAKEGILVEQEKWASLPYFYLEQKKIISQKNELYLNDKRTRGIIKEISYLIFLFKRMK